MRAVPRQKLTVLSPLQSLLIRRWRPQWICQNRTRPSWLPVVQCYSTQKLPSEKPFYITTPIFYVNAAPHVGHMYNMVLTDVIKRWQELDGRRAILTTGTDEHGMKIQQAAAKQDIRPQALCDQNAEIFKDLAEKIGISNDHFIRTTDKRHKEAVEHAWEILKSGGHIYENKHEGWYSVSDETFYPKSQVHLIIEPTTGRKIMASIETGKEVEWTSERNYHFRMSAFKDRLLQWYQDRPDWIVPQTRMDEVVREVTENLGDLSISRPSSRLTWGVPVPGDASQTIYVWLDALLSYASAIGYPFAPGKETTSGWPANAHVIGKDIVRFHCIYWPALLMALDLPLPERVLTHGHWTLNRKKMAKSTGNGVNPFFAMDRFGRDALRWFLIHDGGILDDANYDNLIIVAKYQKGLQNGIGNLASRLLSNPNFDIHQAVTRCANEGVLSKITDAGDDITTDFLSDLRSCPSDVKREMQALMPNLALRRVMDLVHHANAYIQHAAPWMLSRKMQIIAHDTTGMEMYTLSQTWGSVERLEEELDRSLFLCAESIRLTGIMLQAFIPDSAKKLLDLLGVKEERRSFQWCELGKDDHYGDSVVKLGKGAKGALFPRLVNEDSLGLQSTGRRQ